MDLNIFFRDVGPLSFNNTGIVNIKQNMALKHQDGAKGLK